MPSQALVLTGTPIVWANVTDYSSAASGYIQTHQLNLTGLLAAAARQGAKADLGATRATKYAVMVAIEFVATSGTLSGEKIDVYFGPSPSATAANANPGGLIGADAAYTGTAGDSIADSIKQLQFAGSLFTTTDDTTVVQYQKIGELYEPDRYLSPVVINNSTGALVGDAVEMYIALVPIITEAQ